MSYQEHNLTEMEDRVLGLFDKGLLYDSDIELSNLSTYDAYAALLTMTSKGLIRKVATKDWHYELTTKGKLLWTTRASEES